MKIKQKIPSFWIQIGKIRDLYQKWRISVIFHFFLRDITYFSEKNLLFFEILKDILYFRSSTKKYTIRIFWTSLKIKIWDLFGSGSNQNKITGSLRIRTSQNKKNTGSFPIWISDLKNKGSDPDSVSDMGSGFQLFFYIIAREK